MIASACQARPGRSWVETAAVRRKASLMRFTLLILIAMAGTALADGAPYGKAPCDDVEACEAACAHDAAACTWGGHLLLRSGLGNHTERAAALFARACAKGSAEGCWRAGRLADPTNRRGTADRGKARAYYERACARRLVRGCLSLAQLEGAPGDAPARRASDAAIRRAIAIDAAACARKDAAACDEAARLSAIQLTRPDPRRAAIYRDRACRIRRGVPCDQPTAAERTCQADATRATAADRAATAANERRYQDALAREHIRPVQLVVHTWAPRDADRALLRSWRLDAVVELPLGDGRTVRVIAGPDTTTSSCHGPAPEYVQRGIQIFRVLRKPHTISDQAFTVCGCYPYRCGGARPAVRRAGYELPPGTTFGGTIAIAYDVDIVTIAYAPTRRCPGPPP